MLYLHTLLKQLDPALPLSGIKNVEVRGVSEDSRLVEPGHIFVARCGTQTDGKSTSPTLILGVAVVTPDRSPARRSAIVIALSPPPPRSWQRLLRATSHKFKCSASPANGKTTTTYLIPHPRSRETAARPVGTVDIDDGRTRRPATMTTPAPSKSLSCWRPCETRAAGPAPMEVSSHAARPGSRRRRQIRRRGHHQPHRRSPRLSQVDGKIRGCQGATL